MDMQQSFQHSNVNLKHKNSVFSALFGNPETLRELYSAIEGVEIPPDAVININTLSDVLFMDQINDVSFTIDDRIVVLIEHQSTINDNLPIRLLMYIARIYEKTIDRKKLYKSKQVKIPIPEFIVLYNGKEPYPDYAELKLSSAFKNTKGLKLTENGIPPLELVVHVYNINHGRNPHILAKSKTLDSYSIFMEKIREYNGEKSLEESVRTAVKYCQENNILNIFLKEHASEVVGMMITEWNTDEAKEVWYEEGLEDGLEKGLAQGKLEIARNLLAKGSTFEFISEITGLSQNELEKL